MTLLKKDALKALVVGSGLLTVCALSTSALAAASFTSTAEFEFVFTDIPIGVDVSLDPSSFQSSLVTDKTADVSVVAFGGPLPGSSATDASSASVSFDIVNNSSVQATLQYVVGYSISAEVSQGGVPDDDAFAMAVVELVLPGGNVNEDVEALLSGPLTASVLFPPSGPVIPVSFDLAAGETTRIELTASASGRAQSGAPQASVPAPSILALLTMGLGLLTLRLRKPS